MSQSSRLQLPYLASGQAQKHVTMNESLLRLDALVQLSVVSAVVSSQPASPADGDLYILPAGKSGSSWGAMANNALAYYRDGVWEEIAPREGFFVHVDDVDQIVVYSGSAWTALSASIRVSATDKILGRVASGAGAAQEITFTDQAQALCDDPSFQEMCGTLGTWRVLGRSGVAVSHTGTTSETTLATVSVPANAMGPNGLLRISALWGHTNSANTKTLRVSFGGTNFLSVAPSATSTFQAITTITNRNATNSQIGPPSNSATASAFGTVGGARVAGSVDTTSAQDILFKATLANAGENITLESYLVELAYGA